MFVFRGEIIQCSQAFANHWLVNTNQSVIILFFLLTVLWFNSDVRVNFVIVSFEKNVVLLNFILLF